MSRPAKIISLFAAITIFIGLVSLSYAGEIQEIQIGDPKPDHGAGEAPWGPEGTAERQRRRAAKLDYTQAMDEFNAGNYEKSAQLIRNYLAVFPADTEAKAFLAKADKLARAQKHGWLKVTCRPKAEVFIDGEPMGQTPLKTELPVGAHEIEVRAQGRSQSSSIYIKPRTSHGIDFDLHGLCMEDKDSKQ